FSNEPGFDQFLAGLADLRPTQGRRQRQATIIAHRRGAQHHELRVSQCDRHLETLSRHGAGTIPAPSLTRAPDRITVRARARPHRLGLMDVRIHAHFASESQSFSWFEAGKLARRSERAAAPTTTLSSNLLGRKASQDSGGNQTSYWRVGRRPADRTLRSS